MSGQKSAQRADTYFRLFQEQEKDLHQALKDAKTLEGISALRQQINDLQQRTTEASSYLPSRDIAQYQKALQGLVDAVEDQRAQVAPKKRFAFKRSTAKPSSPSSSSLKKTESQDAPSTPQKVLPTKRSMYIRDLSRVNTLDAQGDVVLEGMEGCIIDARNTPLTTLHLRRLNRCLVLAPEVRASIMVFDCSSCILLLSSQQLRMHTSHHVDVYVQSKSGPIIEGCKEMRFAPLTSAYSSDSLSIVQTEEWSRVQDFDWLQKHVPSPHWCVIPEEARWSGQSLIDHLGSYEDGHSVDEALLKMLP